MSKKKGKKGGKKIDTDVVSPPKKTTLQRLYEEHIDPSSLVLSQQKCIVSVLGLSNYSLYDSIIIEIITDFLRFAKSMPLSSNQIETIYHIFLNAIYKITNDHDCDFEQLNAYINKSVSSQIGRVQSTETTYISSEQSQSIIEFMDQRFLAQYTLYRVALFHNNPSNLRYYQFKKNFQIADIVRFQDEECLFSVEQFRSNDVVLSCLHSDFKSLHLNETDKTDHNDICDTIKYYVSRDQLEFISFVSKPNTSTNHEEMNSKDEINNDEIIDSNETKDKVNNDENEDTTNQTQHNEVQEIFEKGNIRNEENRDNRMDIVDDAPKTLIDVIVNKKVEEKLRVMQQKFDEQLKQCKQQIQHIQNTSN